MAALGKIRKRGVTLVIIIGLGLFAFIAEEAFRSCEATKNQQRQQIGEVLGNKINVQEYQALVDEYQDVLKMTNGIDNLTEEQMNSIKDEVWNSYVNEQIIQAECKKVGLTVTDEDDEGGYQPHADALAVCEPADGTLRRDHAHQVPRRL